MKRIKKVRKCPTTKFLKYFYLNFKDNKYKVKKGYNKINIY